MELFYQFITFLRRLAFVTVIIWLSARVLRNFGTLADTSPVTLLGISLLGSFALLTFYNAVIYPIFVDPLRDLPTVKTKDVAALLPVTNVPRGKNNLEWVKAAPGTDLIYVKVSGPTNVLQVVSPEAHRDVLSRKADDFQKPEAGRLYLARWLGYGVILSEGAAHKQQRKHLLPSFQIQNIRSMHELIAEKTGLMLKMIEKEMKEKGSIEICSWASRLTMDIISPALLSRDFHSLTAEDRPLEEAYAKITAPSNEQTFLYFMGMFLPQWIVQNIPLPANRMLRKENGFIRQTCLDILDKKLSTKNRDALVSQDNEEGTPDILGRIISSGKFSRENLADQMVSLLGAGHETTASSIAWATHLLTLPQYLHCQQRLREEVKARIDQIDRDESDPILPYATLETMPYLNAICEETLRLFPPVTSTARVAIRDTIVTGKKIPAGMVLLVSPWAINRNPEFWGPNAEEMVPERWIDTLPDGTLRANKHGGAPSNMCEQTFLHGPRQCIGKNLAKAELRYALAALFGLNDVRRLPGDNGDVEAAGSLTIKPVGGLRVSVTPVA